MKANISTAQLPDAAPAESRTYRSRVVDYAIILKPRVMSLVVFTGLVGLLLAPGAIDILSAIITVACIAAGAGASGAINMWYDRDIDILMARTMDRPIPAARMAPQEALIFGGLLAAVSVAVMATSINLAAAGLLALTILYYVFIYTMWLKRRTPQNIVIGGASGAFPPMIGWAAVTGTIDPISLVMFAIIFLWTPPHSWALALFSNSDYTRAGVPMMPVVAGPESTKRQVLCYSWVLVAATLLPYGVGMSGLLYAVTAIMLGIRFLRLAWILRGAEDETLAARKLFGYSILYLFLIFLALLADRALSVLA
jgi:protoheme IX farnesyltransferase